MNWKYKIDIKRHFQEETTPALVATLCNFLAKDLKHILKDSYKSNISEESVEDFWHDLKDVMENFEFLRDLTDGTIPESEWEDYEFEGDFEDMFNDYLSGLYDIADIKITLKDGAQEKLIWIQ